MKKINVKGFLKNNDELISYNVIGHIENKLLSFEKTEQIKCTYQINLKTGLLYRQNHDISMSIDPIKKEINYLLENNKKLTIPFTLEEFKNENNTYCLKYSIEDNRFDFQISYKER